MKHPYEIGDSFDLFNPLYGINFRTRVVIDDRINGKVILRAQSPQWLCFIVPEGALDMCCQDDYTYQSIRPAPPLMAGPTTRVNFPPYIPPYIPPPRQQEPEPKEIQEEEDEWSDMRD